jgi:DNA-nicking Smr family endonuclease
MEVDLHGLELSEAMVEIYQCLRECNKFHEDKITFVHGFHSGQVLKNYIRSPQFLQELQRNGFKLKKIDTHDPGKSIFSILSA